MPILARDLDGREPDVVNGRLRGYTVQAGQGPTQIAMDINNPATKEKYGYCQIEPIRWTDIISENYSTFERKSVVNDLYDVNDRGFYDMNINTGDYLGVTGDCDDCGGAPVSGGSPDIGGDYPAGNIFGLKNKAFEVNVSGSLFGGFGFGLGVVFDDDGEYGVFGTFSGILGFGGGIGMSATDITPNPTSSRGFKVDMVEGVDITRTIGVGPASYTWGGNLNSGASPTQGLLLGEYGDLYKFNSVAPGLEQGLGNRPKWSLKLSLEASSSATRTKLFYNSRSGEDEE